MASGPDMTGIQTRQDANGDTHYRARLKDRGKYAYGPWRTSPADARGDRIRMQAQKLDGPLRKDNTGPTIEQLSVQFLAGAEVGTILSRRKARYSPSTVRGYQQAFKHWVNPELGHIAAGTLRRSQVQRWVDWMVPQKAGDTVRNNWSALAALYRWYLRRSDLDDLVDPTEGIELPSPGKPRERYADREEIPALLAALPAALQLPFALAFYAGLRHAEIQGLKWEDIDGSWIHIERSFDPTIGFKAPKSGKPRDVPVFAPLMPYLDLTATGFVVPALRTSQWGVAMLGRSFAKKCEAAWALAGLEPLGLHEARHSFATAAIRAGYDPRTVQEWMGHADSKTTMRIYAKDRGRQAGLADLMNTYLEA